MQPRLPAKHYVDGAEYELELKQVRSNCFNVSCVVCLLLFSLRFGSGWLALFGCRRVSLTFLSDFCDALSVFVSFLPHHVPMHSILSRQVLGTIFISDDIGPDHMLMVGQVRLPTLNPSSPPELEPEPLKTKVLSVLHPSLLTSQATSNSTSSFLSTAETHLHSP
eukprot:2211917-Rhodomonas_salina.2